MHRERIKIRKGSEGDRPERRKIKLIAKLVRRFQICAATLGINEKIMADWLHGGDILEEAHLFGAQEISGHNEAEQIGQQKSPHGNWGQSF